MPEDNVVTLYDAHSHMTVDEALEVSKKSDFIDVVIAGYDRNEDFVVRCSHMSRKDALWISEQLKRHILGDI
jgi:hypothetical protein